MSDLGTTYRDTITGFIGIATARTEYLGNTPSVRLEAVTEQGDAKERWVNESRLEESRDRPDAGFAA